MPVRTDAVTDPLVALGTTVPAWLRQWCDDTGRELDVRVPSDIDVGPSQFTTGLTREVTGLTDRTVWISRDEQAARPSRVGVAIRELPGDDAVLAEAADLSTYLGATLEILHAVPVSFGERSVGLDAAVERGHQLLESASAAAHSPDGCVTVSRLVRTHPQEMVGEALRADVMVIGGPRSNHDTSSGLVRDTALHHAPCPLLLVPRNRPGLTT